MAKFYRRSLTKELQFCDMDELWAVIRSIPSGQVASYGGVGEHLNPPTSGRAVGRWLRNCPDGVPWWRVVGWDGRLPVSKMDLHLGLLQEEILRSEKVEISDGKVDMRRFECQGIPSIR